MIKLLTSAAFVAAMLVASAPASADTRDNGIRLNGVVLNGLKWNGVQFNGITLQGRLLNGITLQGISLNGISLQGKLLNGTAMPAGTTPSEIAQDLAPTAVRLADGRLVTLR